MTPEQRRRLNANAPMWLIRNYYNDLCEYYSGDAARFTRMVVDGGKQLATASPQGWARHIESLAPDCVEFHADELSDIFASVAAWGLQINLDILDEGKQP